MNSEAQQPNSVELVRRSPSQDRDIALVLDSVEYFNKHVVPYVCPAHLPFKRSFIPAEFWPLVPTVLKHVWIVICKTTQCGKALSEPILNEDLVYYRGRSLAGLQKMLSDTEHATTDPYAVALMSVLFVMGADMQLCEQHWTTHLEAARRIILWRGGFQNCLQNLFTNPAPLVNYLYADIITATACNTWSLNSRAVQSQVEYLGIIPQMESQMIGNGHPCPLQILLAITYTNVLRVTLQRPLTNDERESMMSHPFDFETVRKVIESFDSTVWAINISKLGRTLPQKVEDELSELSIACLASLAESFKSAAMLYLDLSTQLVQCDSETVVSAKTILSRNLRNLFNNASADHNGPLHAQLWRFTIWPIVISAYAKAAWNVGEESIDVDFDRLDATMLAFSSGRLQAVVKFLHEVQEKRSAMAGEAMFKWDDGFGQRKAFVV